MLSPYIIQYQKNQHLLISPLISSEVCEIWSCQAYGDGYELSNIWVFPWKLKFYHWQQTLSVVFLEVTVSHCLFLRKCLPDSHIWIIILCSSFIQVKMVFHGKSGWFSFKFMQVLSPETPAVLWYTEGVLWFCFLFCRTQCQEYVFKSWDLIKLIGEYS